MNKCINNGKHWRLLYSVLILSSCCVVTHALSGKSLREKLEYATFKHIVIPAYMKWSDLAETELSYADVATAGAVVGTCYGLKKLNDKTQFATRGCTVGKDIVSYACNNKAKTAVGVGALGALWYLYKAIQADRVHTVTTIEGFFDTLTLQQRQAIRDSYELTILKEQAHNNPACLLDNTVFMDLLTESQKEHLDKVVALYSYRTNLLYTAV